MAITSAFQAEDAGSIPATRSIRVLISAAKVRISSSSSGVERTLGKGEVGGSIPP